MIIEEEEVSAYPVCAGCNAMIQEKYLLRAAGQVWHEDCLRCSCCSSKLADMGSTLFVKSNLLFCKKDYHRMFGLAGQCSACLQTIPALEMVMVMKARDLVYHVRCFTCHHCHQRLVVGDRFYLDGSYIFCERHSIDAETEYTHLVKGRRS